MKESLYPVQGSGVVFRDAFHSQSDTEHINDATVTGVTFSNGAATFAAGNSIAYGPVVAGVKSVRIKGTFTSLATTLLTLSGSHSISVAAGTISATGFSSPTVYVDGSASSTLTAGEHEIIVTTAAAITANTLGIANFEGALTLIDLFRITLTATEVLLLSQNKLYAGLVKQGLVAYYDFTRGSSFDWSYNGHDGTDTNVVYKHGIGCYFNGSAHIACGASPLFTSNDFSVIYVVHGMIGKDLGGVWQLVGNKRSWMNVIDGSGKLYSYCSANGTTFTSELSTNPIDLLNVIALASVKSGQTITQYQNGNVFASVGSAPETTIYNSGETFYLGKYRTASSTGLIGDMVAAMYYNRALSQAEMTQNTQYFKQQGWI